MGNEDIFYDAVHAFKVLLKKKYFFEFKTMNSIERIKLIFFEENFYHIAGIQKLDDINELFKNSNKSLFFKSLLKKTNATNKKVNLICSSIRFDEIIDRLESIMVFESNLKMHYDNGKYIKCYKGSLLFSSQIKYDYVFIINNNDDKQYHYFVKKKNNDEYVIESTFINDTDNYWKGQKLMILNKIDLEEDGKINNIFKK